MNPGLAEEVGKVATNVIEALKVQPAVFALIVTTFGMLGYVFYEANSFNNSRQEMLKIFVEQQREVNQLLAKCVVPK